jgi:hypothetical protein
MKVTKKNKHVKPNEHKREACIKDIHEAQRLLNSALNEFNYELAGSILEWIFDQLTPDQTRKAFHPYSLVECLRWILLLNITGLAASPPGSSARVFYECLGKAVFRNTPLDILSVFPPFFLAQSGKWEKKNEE